MTLPVINGFLCSPNRAQIGVKTFHVPGTGAAPGRAPVRLALRADVAPLLLELLRFWHAEIEPLDTGIPDDWGHAFRPVRGSTSPSFHGAGIAFDANATKHPLGRRGTLNRDQIARLTRKANTLGIRLGANYSGRADEMHGEIIVSLEAALRLTRALQLPGGSNPPPPPGRPPGGRPVLRMGHRGAPVTVVQDTLTRKGYQLGKVDSIFGVGTANAVKAFQRDQNITSDGVVGAITWTRLLAAAPTPATPAPSGRKWPEIRKGSKHPAVGVLQRFLGLTADNDFGPATEAAVRRYQEKQGLAADGIVGPATWARTGL